MALRLRWLVVMLTATGGCAYQSQPLGVDVSDGNLTVALQSLHVGQPTRVQVELLNKKTPVANIDVTLTALGGSASEPNAFAHGQSDANGIFTGLFSSTDANSTFVLNANVILGGVSVPLTPITVTIGAAGAPGFDIMFSNTTATAGDSEAFTLSALDATAATGSGLNVESGYTGVVSFHSADDLLATMPASVTFTAQDHGSKTVTGLIVTHAKTMTLVATDQNGVSGSQSLTVNPSVAKSLVLSASPNSPVAGQPLTVSVVPTDAYGNAAPYGGAVQVTMNAASSPPGGGSTNTTCDPSTYVCSAVFNVTTSGSYSIGATSTAGNGSLALPPSNTISTTVVAASASGFNVVMNPNVKQGATNTVVVSAIDNHNNIVTSYSGSITFSSSDNAATYPGAYSYTYADNGVHTFTASVIFNTWTHNPTLQTLNVAAAAGNGNATVNVFASRPYLTLTLSPSNPNVGTPVSATVAAYDANNVLLASFGDQVAFASSDSRAVLIAPQNMLTNPKTFANAVTFHTAGSTIVSVADTSSSSAVQPTTTAPFTVTPGAATSMTLSAPPAKATSGVSFPIVATAVDAYGNVATGYTGTLSVSSTDPNGIPAKTAPALYSFTGSSQGSVTVTATLVNSPNQTLSYVTSPTLGNYNQTIQVQSTALANFSLVGLVNTTAGVPQTCVVKALDSSGLVLPSFTGAVRFTSSDTQATVPATFTYTAADAGVHTFGGTANPNTLVFVTAGSESLTATSGSVQSTSTAVVISPAQAANFTLTSLTSVTGNAPLNANLKVTVRDAYNNLLLNFTDTASITLSDPQASASPANLTFSTGTATFTATFLTANSAVNPWSATVTDTAHPTLTSKLPAFIVNAGAASKLAFTKLPSLPAICAANVLQVTTQDAYGNTAADSNNITVSFASSAGTFTQTSAPASGVASFTFETPTPGAYTFIASSAGVSAATASSTLVQQTPVVSIAPLSGPSACVTLQYSVTNVCRANMLAQYGVPGTDLIENATLGPNSTAGIYNPNLLYGNPQTFVWDSSRDQPNFNGNVSLQISVAGYPATSVSVAVNNGANFAPMVSTFAAAGAGLARAHGDLDHDGLTDVVVASQNAISYELDGLNGAHQGATLSSTSLVQSLVMASFSDDGNSQVIGCVLDSNTSAYSLVAYKYNGNGNVLASAMTTISATTQCHALKTADINRDGRPDLITTNASGDLQWFLNTGNGTALSFAAPVSLALMGGNVQPNEIRVGDFDRNGAPDMLIVPGAATNSNVLIVFGDGNTLSRLTIVPLNKIVGPMGVEAADFDRDGVQDLLVAHAGANTAYIYYGSVVAAYLNPYLTEPVSVAIAGTPTFPMDVDGNGFADIVSSASGSGAALKVTLSTAAARTFGPVTSLTNASITGAPIAFNLATFSEPGEADLMVLTTTGLQGFLNQRVPACNPQLGAPRVYPNLGTVNSALVADADGDGKLDIILLPSSSAANVNIYIGDGTGLATKTASLITPASYTYGRGFVADLDGDGAVDLAIPAYTSSAGSLAIFAGKANSANVFNSAPTFVAMPAGYVTPTQAAAVKLSSPTQRLSDVAVAVGTAGGNSGFVTLVNHSSAGVFTFSIATSPVTPAPMTFVATSSANDFNKDGIVDLAMLDTTGTVYGMYGSVSGSFTKATAAVTAGQLDLVTDDFTGDGRGDVYTVNPNGVLSLFVGGGATFTAGSTSTDPNCKALSLEKSSNANVLTLAVLCSGAAPRVALTPLTAAGTPLNTNPYNIPVVLPTNPAGRAFMADLSNDGYPDVEALSFTDGKAYVALYDATLTTYYQGSDDVVPHAGNSNGLAIADVNRDGFLDAYSADPVARQYDVWTGSGDGRWDDNPSSPSSVANITDVATGDVDRDGAIDIIASRPDNVEVFVRGGATTFTLTSTGGNRIALSDLNNDGWLDLVAVTYGTGFSYWLNTRVPSAPFSTAATTHTVAVPGLTAFTFGNIDGSGSNSIVVGTSSCTLQGYKLGASSYVAFTPTSQIQNLAITSLAMADFDNNGVQDVVVAAGGSTFQAFVVAGNGDGTFQNVAEYDNEVSLPAASGDRMLTSDINYDGIPDVVIPLAATGTVQVLYAANPNGYLYSATSYMLGSTLGVAQAGDINRDGLQDISLTCASPIGGLVTRDVVTAFSR